MNLCVLSGRLIRNATVRGSDPKTLSFTLETRYGSSDGDKKDRAIYAPCVLFNPSSEIEALLSSNAEGLHVELEGRISGPNPAADGGRRFGTEVIVRNRSLMVSQEPAMAS